MLHPDFGYILGLVPRRQKDNRETGEKRMTAVPGVRAHADEYLLNTLICTSTICRLNDPLA